jgi:hypothetical protein
MSTDRDDEPPHRTRIGATTDSIALIASVNGRGVILAYDGPGIEDYIEAIGSRYLGDLGLDDAPDGLSIWEGHLSTCGEYDAEPCGSFRALTDAEWARLRETGTPWEYDVVRKVDLRPQKATTEEKRKYTSDQRLGHAQTDRERIEAFVARFANPHCICWLPADTDALLALLAEVRADEREACAQRSALVTRIRALQESQIADLEARVRELEAALREIVAIDSASPEHQIAMRALGDSPAVMDTPDPPPSPATNELTHVIDALRNEAERLADVAEEYRREGLTGHVTVTYESVQAFREVADWLESRDGQRAVAQANARGASMVRAE